MDNTLTTPDALERVLVIGEALVEVVQGRPLPGGSPANVAVALGRLARPVVLATQLAEDENGALIRAHLAASHVGVVVASSARTSTARAEVGPSGSAHYAFDVEWDPSFGELPPAAAIHVGSFSAERGNAVQDLLEQTTATVSYDLNVRPALVGPDAATRMRSLVRRADVVKASDEDLAWLYPHLYVADAAAELLALGPAVVYVTLGAAGALVVTPHATEPIPAVQVEVVDTIGAGDTFSAGLIHALGKEGCLGGRLIADMSTLMRAGSFAAFLAAQTATREGADPPREVRYPTDSPAAARAQ